MAGSTSHLSIATEGLAGLLKKVRNGGVSVAEYDQTMKVFEVAATLAIAEEIHSLRTSIQAGRPHISGSWMGT
jgi:hypothetical protein